MGLGATFTEEGKLLGRCLDTTWEITAYEPPHTIQQRTTMGPAHIVLTATLEALNGGTKVTIIQEGESGGLLKVADPLIARTLQKQLVADLETLKNIIETGAATVPA
jgi:hypothetical protein